MSTYSNRFPGLTKARRFPMLAFIVALACGVAMAFLCAPAVLHAAPQATQAASSAPQPASSPCEGLPPGRHALLERMTAAFELTCDQELKIEPLLHDEESVSKPLLRFTAFSPEEKKAVMLKIKVAARRQIRPLLTAEQQKKMDHEIEAVSKGNSDALSGGNKSSSKKVEANVDPYDGEESLSQAIANYSALSQEEKKELILQVKQAARRDSAPQLTAEQQKKIDADIRQLSGPPGQN